MLLWNSGHRETPICGRSATRPSHFRSGRGRLAGSVASAILALSLAACTSTSAPETARTAQSVPLAQAMIFPPPGGPGLVSVVETNFANATRQSITLATDARTRGENKFTITRFSGRGGDGTFGELQDASLLDADLLAEARAAWPDANMEVSPYYAQNAYGPFGYAVGRAASADVCIYGWQRIAPGLSPSGNISRGSVAIRLQVCDRAAGEERLLNLMYQMRLRDPVFEPWRASPRIGAAGAPILPTSAEAPALVAGPNPTPTPAPRPVQPAPAPQPATPVAIVEPQPSGPIVPLPSGSGGGQGTGGGSVTVPLPPSSSN